MLSKSAAPGVPAEALPPSHQGHHGRGERGQADHGAPGQAMVPWWTCEDPKIMVKPCEIHRTWRAVIQLSNSMISCVSWCHTAENTHSEPTSSIKSVWSADTSDSSTVRAWFDLDASRLQHPAAMCLVTLEHSISLSLLDRNHLFTKDVHSPCSWSQKLSTARIDN